MSFLNHTELQDIPCFSCRGTEFENYLKSGCFKKTLDFKLRKTNDVFVELFGKKFPANSCVWLNMNQIFMEIKRNFFMVKGIAVDNIGSLKNDSYFINVECLRMGILKSLKFLLANLQELSDTKCVATINDDVSVENFHLKNIIMQFVKEINSLLLFVGQISSINGILNIRDFTYHTTQNSSNYYHYFHLCLDIWYYCCAMVYNISYIVPNFDLNDICDDFIDQSSPFLQVSSLVMYEFLSLAINRYNRTNIHSNTPYLCSCINEFWIALINLIDKSNLFIEGASFWGSYQSVIQILVKNATSVPLNKEISIDSFVVSNIPLNRECPVEACLWITSHLAQLYKYDTEGKFCDYIQPKSGYSSGKYLIHNLLSSSSETTEKSLRNALSYCLQIVKLWEPKGEILLPLTDFYMKKVEDSFSIVSNELRGLSYLYKDSLSWFTHIANLSNPNVLGKDNSFDRFLRILCFQLGQNVDGSLWRSLKGRVYSKIIPRKIKEISEIGLQNSFSLLLTIAACKQFEVTAKICEVVSVIETTANTRKQSIAWKAIFVLLYICQENKHDMQSVVTLISKHFNSSCSDYVKVTKDSMHTTNIMNLLLIYIDNMGEVFKRNTCLDLSECQLITEGFANLLSACSITEVNYILSIFHSVLQRIYTSMESQSVDLTFNEAQYISITEAVFNHIYPFIVNFATTDTPPQVVSDIAVVLTKITHTFSSCLNCLSYNFHSIFIYFGCKDSVNCTTSCRYLCSILDCPTLIDDLKLQGADLHTIVLHTWLKCALYTHTKCENLQELTKKVVETEMPKIVPDISTIDCDVTNHITTSIIFYRLIGNAFNRHALPEKPKIALKVQQIFKNFASLAVNKIKKGKDGLSLAHVYKLISHLVEYCSTVLHFHVTSDHVLLQLLDQTIYPQILFPRDKALQSLVSCAVKEYLPHFIRGLFKLDYRRDKSVEREIRNITVYYLGIYSPTKNPLTKLAVDSITKKPEGLTLDAYEFLLETLKSSLLSNNIEKPGCIIEFYQEIFKTTPPACKKEITNILLKCSMEIYMKHNDSFSESLKVMIKRTLIYYKEKMSLSHTKIILSPVIQWFIQEKLQWAVMRGFSVLDIFVEYLPQMMSEIVPFLTKSVEILERNRGLGEDMLLRNGLRNIITKLQQKLNAK